MLVYPICLGLILPVTSLPEMVGWRVKNSTYLVITHNYPINCKLLTTSKYPLVKVKRVKPVISINYPYGSTS